ncbi:MAG: VWA domain-containing protein [Bryobacteraceae bacterium]|nr:VWA domain-containing protein [Bryobacteraceae bacterium]
MLLLAFAWAAPAQVPEPEAPTATFSTGTSQVRIDVQVVEGKNVITGLTKDDFLIYDEKRPQPVLGFGREAEPVRLLLLLDISGSMRRNLQEMARTAKAALGLLKPRDEVAVMLFSRDTQLTDPFTADHAAVVQSLERATFDNDLGGGTAINSALLKAAEYFDETAKTDDEQRRNQRFAILIVTDNISTSYKVPDEEVIKALYREDIVLNAIVVGKGYRPQQAKAEQYTNPDFTPADVFKLAEETGGEAVKADRADTAFRDMLERIRTRYSLVYRAPDNVSPGTFRYINVQLAGQARQQYPKAQVRHRSGYYVR